MVLIAAFTAPATRQKRNAERPWRHSHAEREERSSGLHTQIVPTLRVGMHPVTLCVTLSEAEHGASPAAFPRRAWERSGCGGWKIVPHAPRGNAARDAPRSASERVTQSVTGCMPTRSVGTISVWRPEDRSSRSAWERRQGRSAFRF